MPAAENLTKLFFFEEHPLMILGIQRLIEQEKNLELVGHSNDHQTLIDQLRKTRTDLLILDLTFYSSENFEFLQNIRNSLPNLKIIVFSVHTNPACTERVFKTGADGYILKTENPGQIIDAIQTIRNGKTYVSQTIRKPTKKSAATIDSPINLLSPQQFQILQRIGKGET